MFCSALDKDEIEIGNYVLLRIGQDPDYIKELALNNMAINYPNQLNLFYEWKDKFREYIENYGYNKVIKDLGEIKIKNLDISTLIRWSSYEGNEIAPKYSEDFLSILNILNLDKEDKYYIESNRYINSARISAGHKVRDSIKKSIFNKSAKETLYSTGNLRFTIDETDDIKIEAFRVIDIIYDLVELKSNLRKLRHINDL